MVKSDPILVLNYRISLIFYRIISQEDELSVRIINFIYSDDGSNNKGFRGRSLMAFHLGIYYISILVQIKGSSLFRIGLIT